MAYTLVTSPWFIVELIALLGAFFVMISPNLRAVGNMQVMAAVATLVAMFIGRYEYIVGGQLVPLFKGSWVTGLIDYTPSMTEWVITVMAFSLVFAAWAYGEKNLNLAAEPGEK